jgi:hypothetical protein
VKTPLINHWWNVTFVVSPRGLSSGTVPDGDRIFQMDLDFVDSQLEITHLDGRRGDSATRDVGR